MYNFFSAFFTALRGPEKRHTYVHEDPNQIGYMRHPPYVEFQGATRGTKEALLAVMPEEQWDKMRASALDDFDNYGPFDYEGQRGERPDR